MSYVTQFAVVEHELLLLLVGLHCVSLNFPVLTTYLRGKPKWKRISLVLLLQLGLLWFQFLIAFSLHVQAIKN